MNQTERRIYLTQKLLDEQPGYKGLEMPPDDGTAGRYAYPFRIASGMSPLRKTSDDEPAVR